jgi:exodeoxyribonuclease-3
MRLATWNVNSIRSRASRVVNWIGRADVDVLAMQEIKCRPEQFPLHEFEAAGYEVAVHGLNQWNGVAIASRIGLGDVATEFPGMPGFAKGHEGPGAPREARAIGATVDGVHVWSLYVPNGRAVDDPHYDYKLDFMTALTEATRRWLSADPRLPLALVGDFNIAPRPEDVGDPSIVEGVSTHVSPREREAFTTLETAGLQDLVRPLVPTGYTYWDYKAGRFRNDEGLRIDFVLGSAALADTVVSAEIVREERNGETPSDHVPVLVEVADDNDNDDGPMVF